MSKSSSAILPTRIIPVAACDPHPRNYNAHSATQIEDLRESLRQFGQVKPIAVKANGQRYTIIAGEGLWTAAKAEGWQKLNAVLIPAKWSKAKVLAYLAADNELARHASPDQAQLDAIVREVLDSEGEALARLAAGEQAALDRLRAADGASEEPESPEKLIDRAEELQKKWKCKSGEIYRADEHYFICGDCRESETWARLMKAAKVKKVNGVFTSPPYAEQRKKQYGGIPTDKYVEWWGEVQVRVRENLATDGSFFVNIKPNAEQKQRNLYVYDLICTMVRVWKWLLVDEFSWLRSGIPQQVVNRFKNAFEPVYWFAASGEYKFRPREVMHESDSVPLALGPGAGDTNAAKRQGRGGGAIQGNKIVRGMAYPSNVLDFKQNADALGHSAAFPLQLPSFFIKAYSDPGDVWLDNFLGSGTVIVAAHKNGRRGLGIEKLEKYCAVALERLSNLGLSPRRVSDD